MDFLALNEEIKKKELMQSEFDSISVQDAIDELSDRLNFKPLLKQANCHEITDESSAKQALSMSMQARKLKKSLEKGRMKIVRPHVDFQRAINSIVKEYTQQLESIEKSLKDALETWLNSKSDSNANYASLVMDVQDGRATSQTVWQFEIQDRESIPDEYLIVNERKIKSAIRSGIRSIPGVYIYETKNLTMRTKND